MVQGRTKWHSVPPPSLEKLVEVDVVQVTFCYRHSSGGFGPTTVSGEPKMPTYHRNGEGGSESDGWFPRTYPGRNRYSWRGTEYQPSSVEYAGVVIAVSMLTEGLSTGVAGSTVRCDTDISRNSDAPGQP